MLHRWQYETKPLRAAGLLTAEQEVTSPISPTQSKDGWLQVYVDLALGDADAVVLTPQLFDRGDPNKDPDWYEAIWPGAVQLERSGKFAFSIEASGAKNCRLHVRRIGGSGKETTLAMRAAYKF